MNLEESMNQETHQDSSPFSVPLAVRSVTRRSGLCERDTYGEINFERPMTSGMSEINGIINDGVRIQNNSKIRVLPMAGATKESVCKNAEIGQVRENLLSKIGADRRREEISGARRREERGSSFNQGLQSGQNSSGRRNSTINSSLIIDHDDSASSSDAGVTSSNFSNGHSRQLCSSSGSSQGDLDEEGGDDDGDLENKIRWFFKTIEKQEAATSSPVASHKQQSVPITIEDSDDDQVMKQVINEACSPSSHPDCSFTFSNKSSQGEPTSNGSLLGKKTITIHISDLMPESKRQKVDLKSK